MAEVTEGLVVIDEGKVAESTDGGSCCLTVIITFFYF